MQRIHGSGRARAAALLLTAVAVGGCIHPGAGSRYRQMARVLERAEARSEPARADAPLFAAGELAREALVREVLRRNPTLAAARHAWRAALARYPQETSLDDPMFGYGLAPRSIRSSRVDQAHQVELRQRFPFPGKLALRGEIALAEAEAAARDHDAVRLRLAAMASMLFDEYYLLARSLDINRQHAELVRELQRIAVARYEAGQASQQDPIQAEVEAALLARREVELAAEIEVVVAQLAALLHAPADQGLPPPPSVIEAPALPEGAAGGWLERAFERRPELRGAEARIEAEQASERLARREFLPDFELFGGYNGVMQEHELQPMLGFAVNVPLRLARRRAALDQASARRARAERERDGLADEVRAEVRSAAERLQAARAVQRIYEDRVLPASRDRIAAARVGFETGRVDFDALIAAERELRDAELAHEQALAETSRRSAELARAVGWIPGLPGEEQIHE